MYGGRIGRKSPPLFGRNVKIQCTVCGIFTARWAYKAISVRFPDIICLVCAYRLDIPIEHRTQELIPTAKPKSKFNLAAAEEKVRGPFFTRYKGFCVNCEKIVGIGEEVLFQKGKGIWHVNCDNSNDSLNYTVTEEPTPMVVGRKFRVVT